MQCQILCFIFKMLTRKISGHILTIGCEYRHPKGGVAQVMYNYEKYVFPVFNCIVNSGGTNNVAKLLKAISGYLLMAIHLTTDSHLRIVHIHTSSYNSFKRSAYFVRLAKAFGRKVVLHIHGGDFKKYYVTNPKWIASVLNRCDMIVTLSESWKNYFQTITNGPQIRIVENIVAPPQEGCQLWNDGKCHLLFLGKVCKEKGIFDLLDVIRKHKMEFEGKVVLHIGGNGMTNELTGRMQQDELRDIIVYEGFVLGTQKIDLLYSCSAFILPSYTEGLPISILESMSYGKPILATPVGGIPEIVKQGENGILFQPGDKEAIYAALTQFVCDKEQQKYMGKKSAVMIEPHFPNNVSKKLDTLYRELL